MNFKEEPWVVEDEVEEEKVGKADECFSAVCIGAGKSGS